MNSLVFLVPMVVFFLVRTLPRLGGSESSNNRNDDDDFFTDKINRMFMTRGDYYRNVYLKSNAWQRKRYVVLRRDSWTCVYCGGRATQVHHKRYAKRNIGKEPIDWLVSVCKSCHNSLHS